MVDAVCYKIGWTI